MMANNTEKLDSLEKKVKKLIALHADLSKENKILKKELEELKLGKAEEENKGEKKRRGRPVRNADESSNINFEDNKEMRKLINELVEEIDKNIAKLED